MMRVSQFIAEEALYYWAENPELISVDGSSCCLLTFFCNFHLVWNSVQNVWVEFISTFNS